MRHKTTQPQNLKALKTFARQIRENENNNGFSYMTYCKINSKEYINEIELNKKCENLTFEAPAKSIIIRYGQFIIKEINGLFDIMNLNTGTNLKKGFDDLLKAKKFIDNINLFEMSNEQFKDFVIN